MNKLFIAAAFGGLFFLIWYGLGEMGTLPEWHLPGGEYGALRGG